MVGLKPTRGRVSQGPLIGESWAGSVIDGAVTRLLESFGHHVGESAPAAMYEPDIPRHFNTLIAADTEATFQAFEMLIGRPIREEEIEPRNASYRQAGRELGAVAYLRSRAWLGMWARRMADWWTSHDLLVTPTVGAPPQLVAAYGREDILIRVASQLEQAVPWSDRHPPVHA